MKLPDNVFHLTPEARAEIRARIADLPKPRTTRWSVACCRPDGTVFTTFPFLDVHRLKTQATSHFASYFGLEPWQVFASPTETGLIFDEGGKAIGFIEMRALR